MTVAVAVEDPRPASPRLPVGDPACDDKDSVEADKMYRAESAKNLTSTATAAGGPAAACLFSTNDVPKLPYFEAHEAKIPVTRRGLDSSPALFLWESRTTSVDVMSVSSTTRPVITKSSRINHLRRKHIALPNGVGASAAHVGGLSPLPTTSTTALEAHLNEERRVKRSRELRRERKAFLSRLAQEREDRVALEAWAAVRVQAVFRGFLARGRPNRADRRQTPGPVEENRRLVAELQAFLTSAGLPTIPGLGLDGRKAPEGSDWGRARMLPMGNGELHGSRGGGLRRIRSRKHRMFEDEMGTRITKIVRGFLARRRFRRCWLERHEQKRRAGATLIQRAWRSYRKRRDWHNLESGVTDRAAAQIQACWRGVACRAAQMRLRRAEAFWRRKTISATTIQAAARRRIAYARLSPKLTLGLARREREAHAAAAAARPRLRRGFGSPISSYVPSGISGGSSASTTKSSASADASAGVQRVAESTREVDRHKQVQPVLGGERGNVSRGLAVSSSSRVVRNVSSPRESAKSNSCVKGEAKVDTKSRAIFNFPPGAAETKGSLPLKQGPANVDAGRVRQVPGERADNSVITTSVEAVAGKNIRAGVRFASETDKSTAEVTKHVSRAASIVLVQESIDTAVTNLRSTPGANESVVAHPHRVRSAPERGAAASDKRSGAMRTCTKSFGPALRDETTADDKSEAEYSLEGFETSTPEDVSSSFAP